MMTMAGKIPAFFLPVPGQSTKEVAAGSALPGHAEHGLVGVQLCGRRVVCGLCRASILAGLALMQGATPFRKPRFTSLRRVPARCSVRCHSPV